MVEQKTKSVQRKVENHVVAEIRTTERRKLCLAERELNAKIIKEEERQARIINEERVKKAKADREKSLQERKLREDAYLDQVKSCYSQEVDAQVAKRLRNEAKIREMERIETSLTEKLKVTQQQEQIFFSKLAL